MEIIYHLTISARFIFSLETELRANDILEDDLTRSFTGFKTATYQEPVVTPHEIYHEAILDFGEFEDANEVTQKAVTAIDALRHTSAVRKDPDGWDYRKWPGLEQSGGVPTVTTHIREVL